MEEQLTIEEALDLKKFLEHKQKMFRQKMLALDENMRNGTVIVKENGGWSFREEGGPLKPGQSAPKLDK